MGIRLQDGQYFLEDRGDVVLSGDHALISPEEAYNYGVWLLQLVPYVDHLREVGYDGRLLAFADAPWQPRFLQFMGLADRVTAQAKGQSYRVDGPLRAFRHGMFNLSLSARDRAAFARLKHRGDVVGASPRHPAIFVSRRTRSKARPLYRGLVNEDALIDAVKAAGFHVVEPEFLGFAEQISLFRQAELVVGLGGAGMFNTVFCEAGTRVITIESSSTWINNHANLFASAGMDYAVIFGAEDLRVAQEFHKPWSIDVAAAMAAIRGMM